MRIVHRVVLAVACVVVTACSDTSAPSANPALPPPQTVQSLDLKRLSGLWYEIGRIPVENEKTHTAGVVSFTPTANGALALSYRWHEGVIDGPAREATAVAVPEDPAHPARLKLRSATNGLPSALWVLALSPDNMICVVGSPDRKIAMMLHRRPAIFVNTFGELARVLEGQGYPVDRLLLATQAPSAQ
jgi:apolipoprotein D and lipocalin family protein